MALLKKELFKFRKQKLPRYDRERLDAYDITFLQSSGNDLYCKAVNYIEITRSVMKVPDDLITFSRSQYIEKLIRSINDHSEVDYTALVGRYKYESNSQLTELKKVLTKK